MYEVVIKIQGAKEDVKVRAFVDADAMARAVKLAEEEVGTKTRFPNEAITAKLADGPVVIMRSGEKPYWLHADDIKDATGQTRVPEA